MFFSSIILRLQLKKLSLGKACIGFGGKLIPDKAYLETYNLIVIWSKHVYLHQKRGRFGQDLGNLLKTYKPQEQLLVWQKVFR
jgi:hypothetical protein